jgi:hypothetical protein
VPRYFTDGIVDGMEILVGPFAADQLLALINNESVRAPIRRYAPQHNAVFVDKDSVVVLVVRDKKRLVVDNLGAIGSEKCPGSAFFIVDSGVLSSVTALEGRITSCVEMLLQPPGKTHHEIRMIKGKRVLIITEPSNSRRSH